MQQHTQRIGTILQDAGLISLPQLEIALSEQTYYQDLKVGEILALHGWLKQETVDFFAETWPNLLQSTPRNYLGYYLTASGLLNDQQLHQILAEQGQMGMRLGALAVLRGWVTQPTVDFFLKHLAPEELKVSPFKRYKSTIPDATSTSSGSDSQSTQLDDILWIPSDTLDPLNTSQPTPPPRKKKADDDDDVVWVG